MIHNIKIAPQYYSSVLDGTKNFEVRRNDRPYKVGDILHLEEFSDGKYTGNSLTRKILYILNDPNYCKEGYVILGL